MTIAHVLYYIHDEKDRQQLFQQMQTSLTDQGVVVILHAEREHEGRRSQMGQMVMALMNMLGKLRKGLFP